MNIDKRPRRGFSLVEVLTVVAILGLIIAIALPAAGKLIRRARAISATSSMNQVLAKARLNAINRGFQVAVEITQPATTNLIHLKVWEDRNPDYQWGNYTLPGGGTAVETVLQEFDSESTFVLWNHSNSTSVSANAALFNGYTGATSVKGVIVFLPTGALLPPIASDSLLPTTSGGRGIYLADEKGMNFFRLTIPNNYVSKARLDKWVDATAGYYPQDWTWK